MSLDACIELGFQHQPALDAARASLAAAHSGKRGVDRLPIPTFILKDLRVRREQACHGVTIAEAGLSAAEWDTRYSITRNFFTVQYIRSQQKVVDDVLRNLDVGLGRAQKIFDAGIPEAKITQIDLDAIRVQIGFVRGKRAQVENGMLKALAALREAMGVNHDYPLEIAVVDLPPAVVEVKSTVDKKEKIDYRPLYKFNKTELIAAAIANRGEMMQANSASRVTELEVQAQSLTRGLQSKTFAWSGDIHAKPIPQGIFNNEYRPGAIGLEMPPFLGGRKADRVDRASALNQRASAVVDKTQNLVSLDVEAQFLKWQEAVEDIQNLREIYDTAQKLPDQVLKLMQGKDLTGMAIIQSNMVAIQVRTQLNDEMHIHALALAGLERATAGAFRVYPIPVAAASPKQN